MNKNLKIYFKNNSLKNSINIKKTGTKLYFNNKNFINKAKLNFNKYTAGYNYFIKLRGLNTLLVRSFILNKKEKEYVNCIMYPNILHSSLFCKRNVK